MQGVNVVKGDASDPAGLTAAFAGATSAYVIVPGVEVSDSAAAGRG